jgi:hypothetical protein
MFAGWFRREIRLMREQPGPITCLECNLVLDQPRVKCPRCEFHYTVGRCQLCHAENTIVNGQYSGRDPDYKVCLSCAWAGEGMFRRAVVWSAPLGFASWWGYSLFSLWLLTRVPRGVHAVAPHSWPQWLISCVVAIVCISVFGIVAYGFHLLIGTSAMPDFPGTSSHPLLAWIVRANPRGAMQWEAVERPWEHLADVRRPRDVLLLAAWTTAAFTFLFQLIGPALAATRQSTDILIAVAAALVTVKLLSRLFVTMLISTSWYRAAGVLTELDSLAIQLAVVAYVYILGAAGIFVETVQERIRARQ